ncbi:hypothetical protein P9112_014654 [Eukaryota sp. TZLM1-RC]
MDPSSHGEHTPTTGEHRLPPQPPRRRMSKTGEEREKSFQFMARATLDERDLLARRQAAALMAHDPALNKIPFGTAEYFSVFDRLVATWQNIVNLTPEARAESHGRIGERRRSISFTPEGLFDEQPIVSRRRHTITTLPSEFGLAGVDETGEERKEEDEYKTI